MIVLMARAKGKVFVGMSGGVDSSVAALLLKRQGYDVTGVFMRCYNVDGCAERDAEDARRVAEHIGIPFYTFDFEEEYKKRVVTYMVEGYRAGLTPNPDVMCNREIKFGLFFKKAMALGADYVATGHYARVRRHASARGVSGATPKSYPSQTHVAAPIFSLFEGRDKNKDQSYFLWTLTQKELSRTLFPVGGLLKPEVRTIAKKAGLPTAEKKDSQGICFLGDVSLMDFLKDYLPSEKGAVFDLAGERIGEHEGAHFYTIGQRHIGVVPHTRGGETKRHYVVEKDVATNTVVVAEGPDNPALYRKELKLTDVNFIRAAPKSYPSQEHRALPALQMFARVRYRQLLAKATLARDGKRYTLTFAEPQKFIAPGQSAVWYAKNGELIGGGIIEP